MWQSFPLTAPVAHAVLDRGSFHSAFPEIGHAFRPFDRRMPANRARLVSCYPRPRMGNFVTCSRFARFVVAAGWMALPGSSALAATLVWTNTAGGNWKGAQNWSPNLVPGELDSAIISVPGTYTVTVSASARMASLTLGSASGLQTLSVTAGTLSVSNSGSIGTNGVLTLTAGTLGGGTMTLQGTMNWSAGTLQSALNIASGGTLNISGTSRKFLNGGQLINSGTLVWSGTGGLTFGEGGTIDNQTSVPELI